MLYSPVFRTVKSRSQPFFNDPSIIDNLTMLSVLRILPETVRLGYPNKVD